MQKKAPGVPSNSTTKQPQQSSSSQVIRKGFSANFFRTTFSSRVKAVPAATSSTSVEETTTIGSAETKPITRNRPRTVPAPEQPKVKRSTSRAKAVFKSIDKPGEPERSSSRGSQLTPDPGGRDIDKKQDLKSPNVVLQIVRQSHKTTKAPQKPIEKSESILPPSLKPKVPEKSKTKIRTINNNNVWTNANDAKIIGKKLPVQPIRDMPLTPAEKMKRYREKFKKDPERYKEYKNKDLQRIKIKNKKIKELTETEKEAQRKIWREQKRKSKKKKSMNFDANTQKSKSMRQKASYDMKAETSIKKLRKTANKWRRTCYTIKEKNMTLQRKIEMLRKKHYRIQKEKSQLITKLEEKLKRMQIRQEVLEGTLKAAYRKFKKQNEKIILKNLAKNQATRAENVNAYVGYAIGLKGRIRVKPSRQKLQHLKTKEEIEAFYLRDDISRCTSGKKECRTLNKEKKQIRYLTDTIYNLYKIYKDEGGKYSFGTFYKYKPFYILSPSVSNRDTCLCIKHSNMEMLFTALLKNGVFPSDIKSLGDVMSTLVCDVKSFECMYGNCTTCKNRTNNYVVEEYCQAKAVQWCQWERADHTYSKAQNGQLMDMLTKKTVKKYKNNTIKELIETFETKIKSFQVHFFNWQHQQRAYREKINDLRPDEAMILCDFSENYECKLGSEVQAIHFGASKQQITLHCGMIYWSDQSQSFCTLSDNKCHEPAAIWAHLMPILEFIKNTSPLVKKIHFFSDGPSSQYRQKKNFYLLNKFTTTLTLDLCTWNFSESGHGKGVADGIGGAVKRTLDKRVAFGHDITNSQDAFDLLTSVPKRIKYFLIHDSDINTMTKILPKVLRVVPGTMQIHQIVSHKSTDYILHRVLTCFCATQDKFCACDCFQLTTHTFDKNGSRRPAATRSTDVPTTPSNSKVSTTTKSIETLYVDSTAGSSAESYAVFPPAEENIRTDEINFPRHPTTRSASVLVKSPNPKDNKSPKAIEILHTDSTAGNSIGNYVVLPMSPMADENISIDEISFRLDSPDLVELQLFDIESCFNDTSLANNPKCGYKNTLALTDQNISVCINEVTKPKTTPSDSKTSVILPRRSLRETSSTSSSETKLNKKRSAPSPCRIDIKRKVANPEKENNLSRKNPSIRTIITRSLQCFACIKRIPFASNNLSKCITCKQWFCVDCTDGLSAVEYNICRSCFGAKY